MALVYGLASEEEVCEHKHFSFLVFLKNSKNSKSELR